MGPGGIGRMLFHLDLTAAQLEQVRSLMQAEREASAPYRESLRGITEQMRQAVESAEFDADAVRALATREAAATIELRVIGAKTQSAIYKLLTDEQKKALADARNDQPSPRPHRGR
jgi:Spy/CpxP family protein refolding chaperone